MLFWTVVFFTFYLVLFAKGNPMYNNIIHSKLNELFDLSLIDWLKCHEYACSNLVKIVCELKKDNPDIKIIDIANILKLDRNTVRKYLKKGNKIWSWVNYNATPAIVRKVEIFKDNMSLGIFENCGDLERQSEKLFGKKLRSSKISEVCRGEIKHYKRYTFKYL